MFADELEYEAEQKSSEDKRGAEETQREFLEGTVQDEERNVLRTPLPTAGRRKSPRKK